MYRNLWLTYIVAETVVQQPEQLLVPPWLTQPLPRVLLLVLE